MDHAVALVQTYLQVNGYFTVAEYPVLERLGHSPARSVTDLDILAFKFPGAGASLAGNLGNEHSSHRQVDSALRAPNDIPDMIVGEVKEGRAEFNSATRDPEVLAAALSRFGCCHPSHALETATNLLRHGHTKTHDGHLVRLIAFGSTPDSRHPRNNCISLGHIIDFLRSYLKQNWETVRHTQFKDSVLGLLAIMEKVKSP